MIPRSELLLDGDLFSLGDFLSSTSVSLGLDCLLLEETDWPSFRLLCTFFDDDMTRQVTRVCRQSCISDEGLWSVNITTWVTLIGSPVKRPGQWVRRNAACSGVASQWACRCIDQSYIAKKPLGFEEHSRLHFPQLHCYEPTCKLLSRTLLLSLVLPFRRVGNDSTCLVSPAQLIRICSCLDLKVWKSRQP